MSIDKLNEVFRPQAPVGTAKVLTSPSRLSNEAAEQACRTLDLDVVLRDLGAIAAREIATELESMGLRAADYSALEAIPKLMAKRLADAVKSNPETFSKALVERLALRG
jgi:hypothetical protein